MEPADGQGPLAGRVNFLDNAVDSATGTIRVKAEFANPASRLWPGMFVNVAVAPRTLAGAAVVPVQAVQTGPESRFVYVIAEDRTVSPKTVTLAHVDGAIAAVAGIEPGVRIVVEGAQNLRPGSTVSLGERGAGKAGEGKGGEGKAGKGGKGGEGKPGEGKAGKGGEGKAP